MSDEHQTWAMSVDRAVYELRAYASDIEEAFDLTRDMLWNVKKGYYSSDYDTRELLSFIRGIRRGSISIMDKYEDYIIVASHNEDGKDNNVEIIDSLIKDIEGIIVRLDHIILSAVPYRAYELTFDEIDAIAAEGQLLSGALREKAAGMLDNTHRVINEEKIWSKTKTTFWIAFAVLCFIILYIIGSYME